MRNSSQLERFWQAATAAAPGIRWGVLGATGLISHQTKKQRQNGNVDSWLLNLLSSRP